MIKIIKKIPGVAFILSKRRDYITKRRIQSLKKYGISVLEQIKKGLDSNEIEFWVEFGTLLGVVREKNFLKNDEDIDLGAYFEDSSRIREFLLSNGFKKKHDFRFENQIVEERYSYKTLGFDFHYFFKNKDTVHTYLLTQDYPAKDYVCDVYKYTYTSYSEVKELEFGNILVNVQEDYEKVLEEKYGPNWKIPTSKWDFNMSPVAELLEEKGKLIKL